MRARLLALLATASLFLLGAVPAQADGGGNRDEGNPPPKQTYLALGDSVAFGTDPNKLPSQPATFSGYTDIVASSLNLKETNPSCPGEASGGFINVTGLDNVCQSLYRKLFPLHVTYTGPNESQLQFAVDYLRHHSSTRLITIDLGANDLFKLSDICATAHPNDSAAIADCVTDMTPTFLSNMESNLEHIFKALRANYHGTIVALTYYALVYDQAGITGTKQLNAPMIDAAHEFNVRIASGFDAFKALSIANGGGDSCKAGLRIMDLHIGANPPQAPSCDVHPTPAGHQLLANAILKAVHGDEGDNAQNN
jgi:lysophospholipase L1-like esterase